MSSGTVKSENDEAKGSFKVKSEAETSVPNTSKKTDKSNDEPPRPKKVEDIKYL